MHFTEQDRAFLVTSSAALVLWTVRSPGDAVLWGQYVSACTTGTVDKQEYTRMSRAGTASLVGTDVAVGEMDE
jgi:hypothetical protein